MSRLTFTQQAWEEYLYWQQQDKKTTKRINMLLKDIDRSPFEGIGEPEPLKHFGGAWSRRINEKDRLVYKIEDGQTVVLQCRGHYSDK